MRALLGMHETEKQLTRTEARELVWEKARSFREYRRRVKLLFRSRDFDFENSASVGRSCRSSYALRDFDSGRLGPAQVLWVQLKIYMSPAARLIDNSACLLQLQQQLMCLDQLFCRLAQCQANFSNQLWHNDLCIAGS